jgi:DNA-binding transcriptional LysR family regulator
MGMDMNHQNVSQRLKVQQLNVLLAVAKTGSMAKAAQHLAMSQPAVSRAISDLEHLFGAQLFDRGPQGVEPTLYGKALLKRSIGILDDLRVSADEIQHLADPTCGKLRIGVTERQTGIIAAIIARLSRRHPRIVFSVTQANVASIAHALLERRVDLVFAPLPTPPGEDVDATLIYHSRLRVAVGARSRWARRANVTLADLADEPWCIPQLDSLSGETLVKAFQANRLEAPRQMMTASTAVCDELVAEGGFIGTACESILRFNAVGSQIKLLPIELQVKPCPLGIMTLRNRTKNPVTQLFIECAREVATPLAKRRGARAEPAATGRSAVRRHRATPTSS